MSALFSSTILKVALVAFESTGGTKQSAAASDEELRRRRQCSLIVGLVSDNSKVLSTLTDRKVIIDFVFIQREKNESHSCVQLSVQTVKTDSLAAFLLVLRLKQSVGGLGWTVEVLSALAPPTVRSF